VQSCIDEGLEQNNFAEKLDRNGDNLLPLLLSLLGSPAIINPDHPTVQHESRCKNKQGDEKCQNSANWKLPEKVANEPPEATTETSS